MTSAGTIVLATRGSALALTQTRQIVELCRAVAPETEFEIKILKTTGDKLQSLSIAQNDPALPRGLFTKELEIALLNNEADMAVHSLKDLPTEIPAGLALSAVTKRADARDVLIYRGPADPRQKGWTGPRDLPPSATLATASVRRKVQLELARPDFKIVPIRGNVGTRLKKLAEESATDALALAAAGLARLGYVVNDEGALTGTDVPPGLRALFLTFDEMLPCVGQGAIGIETRENDERVQAICRKLLDLETWRSVTAERSFLQAMGGGCQSPVGAYARALDGGLELRAAHFFGGGAKRRTLFGTSAEAAQLGERMASLIRS